MKQLFYLQVGCIKLDILEQNYERNEFRMFINKNKLTSNKTVLNERSNYIFGFGGHENIDEIHKANEWYAFGDYGYDPRIVQRPRTEPLASKYPQLSPYVAFNGNPIIYTDPDGRENTIYLVVLPSANSKITKAQISGIIAQANANFEKMGLNTRVSEFKGNPNDFSVSKMDKTDAVAVLGSPNDVRNYVKNTLHNESFADDLKGFGGTGNPEKSENTTEKKGGNIIAISADALSSASSGLGGKSAGATPTTLGALLINHGAGHNAHMNEAYDQTEDKHYYNTSQVMFDGNTSKKALENSTGDYPNMNSLTDKYKPDGKTERNADYGKLMKERFGSEKATPKQ